MKELVPTIDGYQEQGIMAKQSTYNKNKMNPFKPHVIDQSMGSDEGEWNQMSIKRKSKQSYKYPMGKLKQSQTSPQQKSLKKERYEHAYSQPTKIIQESTKTREEKLTSRSEWEIHNKHTWKSSPARVARNQQTIFLLQLTSLSSSTDTPSRSRKKTQQKALPSPTNISPTSVKSLFSIAEKAHPL